MSQTKLTTLGSTSTLYTVRALPQDHNQDKQPGSTATGTKRKQTKTLCLKKRNERNETPHDDLHDTHMQLSHAGQD